MLSFTVLVVMLSSLALLNSVCSYGLPLKMSLSTKKTVSVNTVKAISTAANGKAKSEILFVTSFDENSDKKKNVIDALAAMLNQKVSYQKPQSGVKMSHDTKVLAIGANEVSADDQLLQKRKSFYVAFEGDKMVSKDDLRDACDFTLYVPQQNTDYSLEQSLLRFQKLLDLTATKKTEESILLDAGKWSHFLSLTAPKVESLKSILSDLRVGIDAFELRVDLLEDKSPLSLHRQLAVLRDNCPLPIVYTVRTKSQIGQYPDDDYQGIISLLWEGLRAGVEWLDVEASLPKDVLLPFLEEAKRKYPSTKLLGSLHKTTPCSSEELLNMFEACDLYGYADMLKVVTGAEDRSHCEMVHSVGKQQQKPYIGLCLGDAGSYSRVLNERFTPVTHNMLSAAAPGQLTVEQLMEQREKDGLISMKNYYLFGSPIQHSLSPAMHNGGYKALLLPHQYDLCEQDSIEPYMSKIKDSTFGGASVTIPHKEAIIPMLDEVIGAAATIGAVNTIVKGKDGKLRGYNTDYLGIKKPIARILDRRGFQAKSKFTITRTDKETGKPDNKDCTCGKANSKGIGIVIGAGGTAKAACYAVQDLGLDVVVINRSADKAKELAERFGGQYLDMDQLSDYKTDLLNLNKEGNIIDVRLVKVVISTLPPSANFTLPDRLLPDITALSGSPPVVLDVVYKPVRTALIEQAISKGCPVVQGASMLLEQGIEQFEIWNHRRAPRAEMQSAVFNGIEML